jgi:hypothetical protein
MNHISVQNRASKRKEEHMMFNKKKCADLGLPHLASMTQIQRAIALSELSEEKRQQYFEVINE